MKKNESPRKEGLNLFHIEVGKTVSPEVRK